MLKLEAHYIEKPDFDVELVYIINTMSFEYMHNGCPRDDDPYDTNKSVAF